MGSRWTLIIAEVKCEQERVISEEVPARIAVAFRELFGPGWMMIPMLAARYQRAVVQIQERISSVCELGNVDFEAARSQGFPDDFRPLRH